MTDHPESASGIGAAREALFRHFGYGGFRPGQEAAIAAALAGRDALTVFPTGGGKSVCFQLPPLVDGGLTLVFSPLIALIKDQVDGLRARGIAAAGITSEHPESQRDALRAAADGELRLLYVSPERLDNDDFRQALPRLGVTRVAVDEAHCISQWGHAFRPAYTRLRRVHGIVGRVPVMALTATATARVREDILAQLELHDPVTTVAGFDRPNLIFRHRRVHSRSTREEEAVLAVRAAPGPVIVYATTVKVARSLVELLREHQVRAVLYHGQQSAEDRTDAQDRFMSGEADVVVATSAFGMGIDKPDVRLVLHFDMPGSVEDYYQQAGRAGRDGRPSECLLLADPEYDREIHEFFIDGKYPRLETVREAFRILRSAGATSPAAALDAEAVRERLGVLAQEHEVQGMVRQMVAAGALERHAMHLRLTASNDQVRERVDPGDLELLRALYAHGGREALREGVAVKWPMEAVPAADTDLLRRLARVGVLAWRDDRSALWVNPAASADTALDWKQVKHNRRRDEALLEAMVRYLEEPTCRRRYLLRYFGDPQQGCSGCDLCEARERRSGGGRRPRSGEPRPPPPIDHGLRVNDWVWHPTHGEGCVTGFGGKREEDVFVSFTGAGLKRLRIAVAGLLRLGDER